MSIRKKRHWPIEMSQHEREPCLAEKIAFPNISTWLMCCTQRFPRHPRDSKCRKHPVQCPLLRATLCYYVLNVLLGITAYRKAVQCATRYYSVQHSTAHVEQKKQGDVTNRRDVPMPPHGPQRRSANVTNTMQPPSYYVFPKISGSGESKSRLAKAAGAEV